MADVRLLVRAYQQQDRAAAMSLAPRLQIGVAPWRDTNAVRDAVLGWVRGAVDSAADENHVVLVAENDGEVVGLVTVGRRKHFTGEVDAYVGELIVAEGHERRGIGALLMGSAEQWARNHGFTRMTLETGAANHAARALYAALNYQEEDVRLTKTLNG
jgi:GNAT superfamily N-acetyltransferase